MSKVLKGVAAATLSAGAATFAIAQQTTPEPKSKSEMGAPEQGPSKQGPGKEGVGTRPIGPPDTAVPAPGKNPSGESKEKRKSDQDDPYQGGKNKK